MNTKLITGVAVAVAVVGGGYFLFTHSAAEKGGADDPRTGGEGAAASMANEKGGAFTGSIRELSARGGDWKCTVDASSDTSVGQAVSSGVVYVSGRKVRGDFTTSVPQLGNVESHLIADGTDVYAWSSVLPQGIKTAMTAEESGSGPTSGQVFDTNHQYSYDCQPAAADASLFAPPSSVTFRTI